MNSNNKKSALIVVPHIDDEVFSCWSVLISEEYDKVVVLPLTYNNNQKNRKKAYDNHSICFFKEGKVEICMDLANTPDGELGNSSVSRKLLVSQLDNYIYENNFTDIFIPNKSHHQDHKAANEICLASMRPRKSLKVKGIYGYSYMYHDNLEVNSIFSVLTKEQIKARTSFLLLMDEYDKILDEGTLNSVEILNNISRLAGVFVNADYADRFIPIRVLK